MEENQQTFAIENVAAKLVPFDLSSLNAPVTVLKGAPYVSTLVKDPERVRELEIGDEFRRAIDDEARARGIINTPQPDENPPALRLVGTVGNRFSGSSDVVEQQPAIEDSPLAPIIATGGLVFPYTPTITEGIIVKYEPVEVVHSNESYYAYRNTDNVRIELGNCVWTCDTFDNARYALAALHFFRSYKHMDFGTKDGTGRPPSPMWFSAYGSYMFWKVPCLLERANWQFSNEMDYVGIPNPGSDEWSNKQLARSRTAGNTAKYTWMPIKFEVSSISLIVQHAPKYWLNFSLKDYRSGAMLKSRGSFNAIGVSATPKDPLTGLHAGPT